MIFSIVPYECDIYRIIDILKPIKDFYPNYRELIIGILMELPNMNLTKKNYDKRKIKKQIRKLIDFYSFRNDGIKTTKLKLFSDALMKNSIVFPPTYDRMYITVYVKKLRIDF